MRRMMPTAALLLSLAIAVSSAPTAAAEQASNEQIEELIVTATLSRFSATKSDTPIMETARLGLGRNPATDPRPRRVEHR